MTTPQDVERAVYARLRDMSGAPSIVWEGTSGDPVLPRFEVRKLRDINETISLDGATDHTSEVIVVVVAEEGTGAADTGALYDLLWAEFPAGTQVGAGTVMRSVERGPTVIDGGEIRLTTSIRYRAIL